MPGPISISGFSLNRRADDHVLLDMVQLEAVTANGPFTLVMPLLECALHPGCLDAAAGFSTTVKKTCCGSNWV